MYGAQLIDPKSVICFLSVPSGFIVHTLAISPLLVEVAPHDAAVRGEEGAAVVSR